MGGVLHIARLQQELMFLSVYTVLPSPRTSLIFACHHPHTAPIQAIHPFIAPSIRVVVHVLSDAYDCVLLRAQTAPRHAKGPGLVAQTDFRNRNSEEMPSWIQHTWVAWLLLFFAPE